MWAANWYTGTGSGGDVFFFGSVEMELETQQITAELQESTVEAQLNDTAIEATVMDDDVNVDLETLEIAAGKDCG